MICTTEQFYQKQISKQMNDIKGVTDRSEHQNTKSLLSSMRKGRAKSCRQNQTVSPKTYDEALDRSGNYFRNPQFDTERQSQLFRNTESKLNSINFNHHDPKLCVCDDCVCGRHLCKFHVVSPNLTKSSIYQQSYPKKWTIPNLKLVAPDAMKNGGPHLDMNSTKRKDFIAKKGDNIERPKPQDLLKTGGPSPNLTSYSTQFPGFKGDNQYIKPTDKHVRGQLPLMAQTTYGKSFGRSLGKPANLEKTPDSLKHGQPWFGTSTYGTFFKAPNPQDYAQKYKVKQKLQVDPGFNHQYETTYKNDFLKGQSKICPSKIKLETKIKGLFSNSKGKFAENTDFKAFTPQFHALSLSKQSFV